MGLLKELQTTIKKNLDGFIFGGIAGLVAFQFIKQDLSQITITFNLQSITPITSPEPGVFIVSSAITMVGFFLMGSSIGMLVDILVPSRRRIFK